MISAINWVPRGAANPNPPRYQVVIEEVEQIKERARVLEERAKGSGGDHEEDEEGGGAAEELDENGLPKSLHMEDYDDEDDDVQLVHAEEDEDEEEGERQALEAAMDEFEQEQGEQDDDDGDGDDEGEEEEEEDGEDEMEEEEGGGMDVVGGTPASELVVGDDDDDDDDDESDIEDLQIRPTDAVMLVATTEEQEHSTLEVHVYEENTGNLYVHHDITLPAFPLCLAWGNYPPRGVSSGDKSNVGSFAAVGTFQPGIEIWDLDVIDPLEPVGILGGEQPVNETSVGGDKDKKKNKKKKKKKDKGPVLKPESHTDAVMSLSWNREHRQVLASGSADHAVKLWDLSTMSCSHTCTFHTDKVVSVQWHPVEGTVLATASFDRTSHILDGRSPNSTCRIGLTADAECLSWDPHNPSHLYLSTEDGRLAAYDVHAASSPLFSIKAHNNALSCFAFSPGAPGLLATCSVDKTVKLWDTKTGAAEPALLGEKSMAVGKLFTMSFYPSSPFLLATGGDKGMVALWNVDEIEPLAERFRQRMGGTSVGQEAIASSFDGMTINIEEEDGPVSHSGAQEGKSKKKKKKGGKKE